MDDALHENYYLIHLFLKVENQPPKQAWKLLGLLGQDDFPLIILIHSFEIELLIFYRLKLKANHQDWHHIFLPIVLNEMHRKTYLQMIWKFDLRYILHKQDLLLQFVVFLPNRLIRLIFFLNILHHLGHLLQQ